jgi:subtilase-type serine protease
MKYFLATIVSLAFLSACGPGGSTTPYASSLQEARLAPADLTVTPINAPDSVFPGATTTEPTGLRGKFMTATVSVTGGATFGALYDWTSQKWLSLQAPGASSTAMYGPALTRNGWRTVGSFKVAGQAGDQGVIYNSANRKYTTINAAANLCAPKSCNYTIAHSSYGDSAGYLVVGNYDAVSKSTMSADEAYPVSGHAFLYDSAKKTFTTIDLPNAVSTTAYGIWIDGKTVAIAGGYADKTGRHAYVRDAASSKLVTYDFPAAALTHFEGITGAGGAGNYNLAGDYSKIKDKSVYGFFIQMRNWKFGKPVTIGALSANSVFRRRVIGVYKNSGKESGFYVHVPK